MNFLYMIVFIVAGGVYFDTQAKEDCEEYKSLTSPNDNVTVYTHIVKVEENVTVTFFCGDCCDHCWRANHLTIEQKTHSPFIYEQIAETDNCYRKLSILAGSEIMEKYNYNTFTCIDRSDCTRELLPICYNNTISNIILVQVVSQVNSTTTSEMSSTTALFVETQSLISSDTIMNTISYSTPSSPTVSNCIVYEGSYRIGLWVLVSISLSGIFIFLTAVTAFVFVQNRKKSGCNHIMNMANSTILVNPTPNQLPLDHLKTQNEQVHASNPVSCD